MHKHWSQTKEKGSALGMKIVLYSYKFLGRFVAHLLLYPITAYFYCTSPSIKKASKQYFTNLHKKPNTFKHLLSFADAMLDKLAVWNNDLTLDNIDFVGIDLFRQLIAQKKGGVIFTAHLGNIEIARALAKFDPTVKLNILLFYKNAKKINAFLEATNSQFEFNIIPLDRPNVNLAIQLKEKVDAGEFIVIACDRTSITQPHRNIKAQFLGHPAYFPQGPFILAGLLECPVYFMFCFKQNKKYFKIIFEEFAPYINIAKLNREKQLEYYAQQYAQLLEKYCHQYPLQWFNFFDFWKANEN